MAAVSNLQKLLKNAPQTSRILTSLRRNPFPLHPQSPKSNDENHASKVTSFSNPYKETSFTHFDNLPFSAIHPYGLCPNPILASGSMLDLENNEEGMWADSVKKKRKKKMNKHKYKKLRKRLRRQT